MWTVRDKGWLGKKNGVLLQLTIADSFELFVTVDRNLSYQQNLERLPIPIFVLCAYNNRRETLAALLPKVFAKLDEGDLPNVTEIW